MDKLARPIVTEPAEPIVLEDAASWSKDEYQEVMRYLNDRGNLNLMEQIKTARDEAKKPTDWEPAVSDEERQANAETAARLGFVAPENDVPSDQFEPDSGAGDDKAKSSAKTGDNA